MNTKKIKFTANNEVEEIEVQGCYPYLVNSNTGKVVLRITTNEADTSFENLYALKNNESGIVEYYEKATNPETGEVSDAYELKNTYTDYNSGDVHIDYENGQYRAEVTRVDGMVKDVAKIKADVDYIATMADIPLE